MGLREAALLGVTKQRSRGAGTWDRVCGLCSGIPTTGSQSAIRGEVGWAGGKKRGQGGPWGITVNDSVLVPSTHSTFLSKHPPSCPITPLRSTHHRKGKVSPPSHEMKVPRHQGAKDSLVDTQPVRGWQDRKPGLPARHSRCSLCTLAAFLGEIILCEEKLAKKKRSMCGQRKGLLNSDLAT